MLTLLSPAKKLDEATALPTPEHTQPAFLDDTRELLSITRELSADDLSSLMKISDNLATLNHERFQSFELPLTSDNARPAALTFAGEVYTALDAWSLSEPDLQWAQSHVRILSGLFGILKPLDLIQPYRLEMGTRLANPRGRNLYDFWRDTLTPALAEEVAAQAVPGIVNLASNEYSKAVRLQRLDVPVITPKFQDVKEGKARTLFLFAKRARGWMTRWIIEERVDSVDALKEFTGGGYRYEPEHSTDDTLVFRRPQPPPAR